MNVRCCDNGDILTAESSIGTIKRFNKNGELVGIVGKAKIGGGCKHVALGFDSKRDRYYMMNVDKSHICVLVPNAEAPEITADEALAKEARDGLGRKLVGEWSLDGKMPSPAAASAGESSLLGALLQGLLSGDGSSEAVAADPYASSYFKFDADGKLTMLGGQFAGGENAWEPVRQDGNTLIVSQIQEDVQYYEYKIEFVTDDEATISMTLNEQVLSSNRFKRVVAEAEPEKSETSSEEPASRQPSSVEKTDAAETDVQKDAEPATGVKE
jgi:hypothetical protein